MINVSVTGANGFIGKYLVKSLVQKPNINLNLFNRGDDLDKILHSDYIFHIAGLVNQKKDGECKISNYDLTKNLCSKLESNNQKPVIIFSSSNHVFLNTPYGISKKKSEEVIEQWTNKNNGKFIIYRLDGVFGKQGKPNYNSVVSTFCYNIAREIPVQISNHSKIIELIHIDDVVNSMISILDETNTKNEYRKVNPVYKISVGILADTIKSFHEFRNILNIKDFKSDLHKHLYEIYMDERNNYENSLSI